MAIEHRSDSALADAVVAAGSQSEFARRIGRRQSTVHHWLKNNVPLPAEHVLVAEAKTGVPKERLRPDLYPPASATPAEGMMDPVR